MNTLLKSGFLLTLLILLGCEDLPDPAGRRHIAVIPAIEDLSPGIFDSKDLGNSYIEFKVTIPAGSEATKVTVLGSYNDNRESVSIAEVTSFPATVRISSTDAAARLGIPLASIHNGDVFTFELLTEAQDVATLSPAVVFIPVACAYNASLATGSYHSKSADWNSEGNITLTADPDNKYKIYVTGLEEMEGLVEDLGPLVMYINPATYAISVPEKAICSDGFGYGALKYSGSGVYNSCNGSYTMYFDISLAALGSQGTFKFDFTRN